MPHRPYTTLGMAASNSTMVRNTAANFAGKKSCVRKIAMLTPKKPAISNAINAL